MYQEACHTSYPMPTVVLFGYYALNLSLNTHYLTTTAHGTKSQRLASRRALEPRLHHCTMLVRYECSQIISTNCVYTVYLGSEFFIHIEQGSEFFIHIEHET